MRLSRFYRLWTIGAFAFMLSAPAIGHSQTKPAVPIITVYQDPT